jgi:hypothetical protein
LKNLDICINKRGTINTTDASIIIVADKLIKLEELNLFSCRNITDYSRIKIVENLIKLNNLSLYSANF